MPFRLEGRVALVTGGSRGIGRAVAAALLDAGAATAITGLDERRLRDAEQSLTGTSSRDRLLAVRGDVRRPEEVDAAVARVIDRFGGLDILVNNAGVGWFADVADLSLDRWRQVIDTNLSGVFFACRAAIPPLKKRGGGWIINISSLAGKNPFPGGAAYCASKAGLNAFSEALMQEVRYDNIRVSYILPGSVRTGFAGHEESGADWKLRPEDVAQVVLDLIDHDSRSLPSRVELRPARPRK